MSILKKIFGRKKSVDDIEELNVLRLDVIERVKNLGSQSSLSLDADNPAGIHVELPDGSSGHVDIRNLYGNIKAYPDTAEESLLNFTQMIVSYESQNEDVNEEDIVIVIRPTEYVQAVKDGGAEIISSALVGDLHTVYMVDSPQAMRALSSGDIGEKSDKVLYDLALGNVRKHLPNLVSDASTDGMTLYYVEGNTFLTSSLILLDEFWDHVERSYGEDFIFIMPRKDQIMTFDPQAPNGLDYAKRMIEVTFEEDFNLLSNMVFLRTQGKTQVFK